ncbi:MAG TPA: hypothetical protein P5081_18350 [Phycisphaerae bacterium]|nr:hypothetical protein [Phycisphaerae bacterium]HRW54834.1 hypothetical protein [Phycisphaerae bacterium]
MMRALEAHPAPPVDYMTNCSLSVPAAERVAIERRVRTGFSDIASGLSNDDIPRRPADAGLDAYFDGTSIRNAVINATLQFFCGDHDLRDITFVVRDVRLIVSKT